MSRSNSAALPSTPGRIRIGISSCLLGDKVRYDGNHRLDTYITGTLGRYFEYVPVCPEVAIGLGVPRPPIRLVGAPKRPRACGVDDPGLDLTEKLAAFGTRMGRELADISGYILKSKSPSCGVGRVRVYRAGRPALKRGRGIYAAAFIRAQTLLPVEEEGRLGDPDLRENFIERVFAYQCWRELIRSDLTPAKLVAFHTDHELAVMAHGIKYCQTLGRLAASAGRGNVHATATAYIKEFMTALAQRATPRRHAKVLMHLMGDLKKHLDRTGKQELLELIEDYRLGRLPRIVPITLLKHYFRLYPSDHVVRQTYLNPHPQELMLRNTA